jgi:hypothetical protein
MRHWRVLAAAAAAALLWAGAAAAGPVEWVPARQGRVPSGAVAAGEAQGRTLYVCKADYKNGEHVGKVFDRACYIGWGGEEVKLSRFRVLVARDGMQWVSPRRQPRHPVGGQARGQRLLVCRTRYRDGVHYGKEYQGRCHIGWGGREVAVEDYDLLSAPGARWVSAGEAASDSAVGGAWAGGAQLYVCRARLGDGTHPGKLWNGRCHIGWGGQEKKVSSYQVLVAPGALRWEANDVGWADRCLKAAQGPRGWQCVCRARYKDGLHVGKTVGGECNIGWGGREVVLQDFEVLVGGGGNGRWSRPHRPERTSRPSRGRGRGMPRADDYL